MPSRPEALVTHRRGSPAPTRGPPGAHGPPDAAPARARHPGPRRRQLRHRPGWPHRGRPRTAIWPKTHPPPIHVLDRTVRSLGHSEPFTIESLGLPWYSQPPNGARPGEPVTRDPWPTHRRGRKPPGCAARRSARRAQPPRRPGRRAARCGGHGEQSGDGLGLVLAEPMGLGGGRDRLGSDGVVSPLPRDLAQPSLLIDRGAQAARVGGPSERLAVRSSRPSQTPAEEADVVAGAGGLQPEVLAVPAARSSRPSSTDPDGRLADGMRGAPQEVGRQSARRSRLPRPAQPRLRRGRPQPGCRAWRQRAVVPAWCNARCRWAVARSNVSAIVTIRVLSRS
jgi:hypothetical protein